MIETGVPSGNRSGKTPEEFSPATTKEHQAHQVFFLQRAAVECNELKEKTW
jgi:hypothetical protein